MKLETLQCLTRIFQYSVAVSSYRSHRAKQAQIQNSPSQIERDDSVHPKPISVSRNRKKCLPCSPFPVIPSFLLSAKGSNEVPRILPVAVAPNRPYSLLRLVAMFMLSTLAVIRTYVRQTLHCKVKHRNSAVSTSTSLGHNSAQAGETSKKRSILD